MEQIRFYKVQIKYGIIGTTQLFNLNTHKTALYVQYHDIKIMIGIMDASLSAAL